MAVIVALIRAMFVDIDRCRTTIMDRLLSERVRPSSGWLDVGLLLACGIELTYIDVSCVCFSSARGPPTNSAVRRYGSHPFPGLNVAK